jgi:hypothetical protein
LAATLRNSTPTNANAAPVRSNSTTSHVVPLTSRVCADSTSPERLSASATVTTASTPLPWRRSAAPYAANGITSTSALPAGWAGRMLSNHRVSSASAKPTAMPIVTATASVPVALHGENAPVRVAATATS